MVLALGLLGGGALGNFYDRYFIGCVRDFLKVFRGEWVWPNFNLADSAICIGVGMIFLREIFGWGAAKREAATTAPEVALQSAENATLDGADDAGATTKE